MSIRSPRQVLELGWDGKLPVDVAALARCVGLQVQQSTSVAVADLWQVNGTRVIQFNPSEGETRRRFALAHLLGHHLLEHAHPPGGRRSETLANFGSKASADEREANNFALCLLVPESTLRYAIEHGSITDVSKLAATFGVSPAAMSERLKQLRIA